MQYEENLVNQLSTDYAVESTTIEFLLEMYGKEILEVRLKELSDKFPNGYSDIDVIQYCENISESAKVKVVEQTSPTPPTEVDSAEEIAKKINTVSLYILMELLAIVSCIMISILFNINLKYLIYFNIMFVLIYKTIDAVDTAKQLKRGVVVNERRN